MPTRSRKPVQYPKTKEPVPDASGTIDPPPPPGEAPYVELPKETHTEFVDGEYVRVPGPKPEEAAGITPDTDEAASYPLAPGPARIEQPRDAAVSVPALRPAMPTDAAGTYALATMTDQEFSERLATLKRGRDRIAQIQRELMEVDVDYGLIPGTPKPTLFKPGAEKLALIYGLAADLQNTFVPGDGETQPPLKYESACFLHLGSFDGPIVAVGHGTANGWEKRYRREADKACPNCGATAIIKSKAEYGGGWYCFPKKGGCGSKFAENDEALAGQATDARGDPVLANDLQNTLLKMSEKRAFVDAVLRATASSSLFTQDVAEEPLVDNSPPAPSAARRVESEPDYMEAVHPGADTDPEAEVRTADVGEVQRGGHRPQVTDAQIEAARTLARSLKLNPWQVAAEIGDVVEDGDVQKLLNEIAQMDEKAAAGVALLGLMKGMDPDDMGKVIQHLRKLAA